MRPGRGLASAGGFAAGVLVFLLLAQLGYAIPLIPAMGGITAGVVAYRLLSRLRSVDPRVLQDGGWR